MLTRDPRPEDYGAVHFGALPALLDTSTHAVAVYVVLAGLCFSFGGTWPGTETELLSVLPPGFSPSTLHWCIRALMKHGVLQVHKHWHHQVYCVAACWTERSGKEGFPRPEGPQGWSHLQPVSGQRESHLQPVNGQGESHLQPGSGHDEGQKTPSDDDDPQRVVESPTTGCQVTNNEQIQPATQELSDLQGDRDSSPIRRSKTPDGVSERPPEGVNPEGSEISWPAILPPCPEDLCESCWYGLDSCHHVGSHWNKYHAKVKETLLKAIQKSKESVACGDNEPPDGVSAPLPIIGEGMEVNVVEPSSISAPAPRGGECRECWDNLGSCPEHMGDEWRDYREMIARAKGVVLEEAGPEVPAQEHRRSSHE